MSSTKRGYERHVSDYYRTPIPAIVEFLESYHSHYAALPESLFDPCAGGDKDNPMSYPKALQQVGYDPASIFTMDIREDSRADIRADFLSSDWPLNPMRHAGTIITNPPFLLAKEVAQKSIEGIADRGVVVMLQRLNWLGSRKRKPFWDKYPATDVFVHHKRMSFFEGATDSVEYAHFVWRKAAIGKGTKLHLL